MKYFIIEIQQTGEDTYATLPIKTADTKEQAESIFYGILQYAAISTIPCHAVAILDETGFPVRHEFYKHEQPVEPDGGEE